MIIERTRGDDNSLLVTIVDIDDVIIVLTTESFILSVSSKAEPTVAPDIFTAAGAIMDSATGSVAFPIPGTTAIGTYFYDIQMIDVDSKIRTIAKGKYKITQDITK